MVEASNKPYLQQQIPSLNATNQHNVSFYVELATECAESHPAANSFLLAIAPD
jgi:hypothetical protein